MELPPAPGAGRAGGRHVRHEHPPGHPGTRGVPRHAEPEEAVDPTRVLYRTVYHHPAYTPDGLAAQTRWGEINGVRRTWFCGAYWGYGFHEDGVNSALAVTRALGMDLPA